MRKISTLYKKNPENLGRVIDEINSENQWVFDGEGIATRKFDGTAAAIIGGELYKRYDVKKRKQVPTNAIPCQEPDTITGHWPHWVKCDRDKAEDKYFFEGFDNLLSECAFVAQINNHFLDGTYELCGPKVQGNPENFDKHILVKHGADEIQIVPLFFDGWKEFFLHHDIEGVVFHHHDGRMCKIRKSDFGIKRQSTLITQ
jgi:hypothetical protein